MEKMEKDIKPQNLKFHCRTCLNEFTDFKCDIDELPRSMFQLLKQSIGYKKTSKTLYPENICRLCYDSLKNYDDFQTIAKKSAHFLEDILKPYVEKLKTTPTDDEETKVEEEAEYNLAASEDDQSVSNDDPLLNSPSEIPIKLELNEIDNSLDIESEREDEEHLESVVQPKAEDSATDKPKQEVKCDICNKTYASVSSLYMHKRSHNAENTFECHVCERGFNKRYRLTYHLKKFHGESPPATKTSTRGRKKKQPVYTDPEADTMPEHEANENSEIIKIKIEKINEKLNEIIATEEAKDDFANINKMCTVCHKTFATTSGLRGHMRTHDDTPRFSCDKCGRGFHKKSRFNHHMEEFHAENPVEIPCKYGCGKTFKHAESAAGHYRVKHILPTKNEAPKDYTRICEICGKICKNISVLKEHHWQHVPLEETPYQCKTCKKRFRTKKHLINHEQRHAGIKKFECPQCGLKKMSPHELRVHMNYHTKAIQHYCSICNKAFTNPGNMRRHEQVVHQGIKKFNCRFCEESFGKAETLKHHEMRHTGERPHKCPHCERCFIQSVALKTHLKTHNKLPKFPAEHKRLEMPPDSAGTSLDAVGLHKLPGFAESQKLTALLNASGINKLPGFSETTQKISGMHMHQPDVLIHDAAGINKLAQYSETRKLTGLDLNEDGQKISGLHMPQPDVLIHDAAGINKLAEYSETRKLTGLDVNEDGTL